MDLGCPRWVLPDAAWQAVACCLSLEDLLSSRLVCSAWRKDLGCFVANTTAIPSQFCSPRFDVVLDVAGDSASAYSAVDEQATAAMDQSPAATQDSVVATRSSLSQHSSDAAMQAAVRALLQAYPHFKTLHMDISSLQEQQSAPLLITCIAEETSSNAHTCSRGLSASCSAQRDSKAVEATSNSRPAVVRQGSHHVCLNAIQRSYHCLAQQEYPRRSSNAGTYLFEMLSCLPQQLTLSGLSSIRVLQLDVFPEQPQEWTVLQGLPALQELLLPSFKPALPHHHLPALATISQLTAATLSVQGSFTSWRSNCDAFASLSGLSRLTCLTLHAFHCPGPQLTAALAVMTDMVQLRLSGRIVLEPLSTLHRLTRLQLLELTQDVQSAAICDLTHHLLALRQLAVGRVTLPPAAPSMLPPAADVWQPPAAAVADQGGADADAGVVAAPAAAEAAAVVVAADAGGGAAVAAAAADGGEGEVMLEDVGAIVDGLIGNLQEGNVPVHLQRIIERFESIIQLDLTRSRAYSPWGWPVLGLPLLDELQHGRCGSSSSTAIDDTGGRPRSTLGGSQGSKVGGSMRTSRSSCGGCSSLELALLRPSDAVRLDELPQEVRCCRHLGLRLRDQLLAFASVSPVRLQPGQLSSLAAGFTALQSLSICGKFAINGTVLCQLTHSLGFGNSAVDSAGGGDRQKMLHSPGLQALSLDCHFVAISPEQMTEALHHLPSLKVLTLRHRGQGKLPIPLQALPHGLLTLAVKKAVLYDEQSAAAPACSTRLAGAPKDLQIADTPCITCHAITSPGFKQAIAAGALDMAPFEGSQPKGSNSIEDQTDPVSADFPSSTSAAGLEAKEQQHATCRGYKQSGACSTCMLPYLQSLLLKNCLVSTDAVGPLLSIIMLSPAQASSCIDADVTVNHQLTRLSITGDNSSHLEPVDGWAAWLEALQQLKGLQVLDLTVPECLGSSMPADLLQTLQSLPRLLHLHLNTSHQPLELLSLSTLHGLSTLSIHYSGPPALPTQLMGQLQAGLGPKCSVRLWEMLVLQHVNSFSGSRAGYVDIEGNEGSCGRRVVNRLLSVVGWGVVAVGGWWCGWVLGGTLEQRSRKRHIRAGMRGK